MAWMLTIHKTFAESLKACRVSNRVSELASRSAVNVTPHRQDRALFDSAGNLRPHSSERHTLKRLTCRQVILDHLDDYLDGSLGPEVVGDFERHLAMCPPCVAYLNTYRRTRELTRRAGSDAMSEEVKSRLRDFLLARLGVH